MHYWNIANIAHWQKKDSFDIDENMYAREIQTLQSYVIARSKFRSRPSTYNLSR